jgi:dGTPase
MFARWVNDPSLLPTAGQSQLSGQGVPRVVADYIAGMTDQFIEDQWRQVQASAKK